MSRPPSQKGTSVLPVVGGDVWRYFARFSAERDIGGNKKIKAGADDSAAAAGIYRTSRAYIASLPPLRG